MKYISFVILCLAWQTSFSQVPEYRPYKHPVNVMEIPDSTVSIKIAIRYTANRNGKVVAVTYLPQESTSSKEQLTKDAKLRTVAIKPIIHTPDGVRYNGTYIFYYTAEGKFVRYLQQYYVERIGMA